MHQMIRESKGQWTGTLNTNYSSDTGYSCSDFSDMKEAQFLQEELSIIGAYVWLIDSLVVGIIMHWALSHFILWRAVFGRQLKENS